MTNVYESCPTFLTDRFRLRLVQRSDAAGLLKVYSDPVAQLYFNADNCHSDFRYTRLEDMQECVNMWLWSYKHGHFVRWVILGEKNQPIGTIEMFRRDDGEHGEGMGLLRIDLMHQYEFPDVFDELFRTIFPAMYELFGCQRILTKAAHYMERRKLALVLHGFLPYKKPIIGENGVEYGDYWVRSNRPHRA